MAMEFWGVEVKQGQSLKVTPEHDKIIHISQASMGEVKDGKAANKVSICLKMGGKNFVIGTLSAGDRPQLMFDLVFEKEFELSHDWKNGSVYFIGYQTMDPCIDDEDDGEEFSFESDEELPMDALENGKPVPKVDGVKSEKKPSATEAIPSKKLAEAKKEESESDEDDDSDEDGEDSDESMEDGESADEDDSDDAEDDSEEETSVKAKPQQIKKRPAEPFQETRGPQKKAKQATPDKSGGKKVAPATSKQLGKSPQQFNNSNKKPQKKFNQRKH